MTTNFRQVSSPKLPSLNFSKKNLFRGTQEYFSLCDDIRHAFEEYGCFLAKYDEVPLQLRHAIFGSLSEELFDLPTEIKIKNTSDIPYYGYFGQIPNLPLLESLGIGDATSFEGIDSFSKLMWPSGNHYFSETIHQYTNHLSKLEQMVARMVFESYGVEQHYKTHMESTTHLLRLAKYRVPQDDETNIGGYEHTDKSFITILYQNQINGLQVKTKNGEWIEVDFLPTSFVIMAGDAFLAWSNNRIHSPIHKVIIKGDETRYSLGFFSYIKGMIQIPDELIDENHPRKFKPFNHFGLLDFFFKHANHQLESTAKAYCGV